MKWTAASARRIFARATQYDRDNPLLTIERPETEALLPELAGLDVVDLGAGHAHYARLARARGARRVAAVDVSAAMLRGVPLPAVVADAAALPLASGSADVVIAALMLSYVDRVRALLEVARVLRPSGVLVISELHARGAAQGGWRRTFRGATGRTLAVEAPPPDPRALAGELDAAGFHLEVYRETAVDQRLEPHFRRAGRQDLPTLMGLPLLVHLVARRGHDA